MIEAPVPPPVIEYVMLVIELLIHTVCTLLPAADVSVNVELLLTVMVPLNELLTHGPVVVTV